MSNQKIQSALDAAGTAADYSARATYQRGFDAGVASVEARAIAAVVPEEDQLLAELAGLSAGVSTEDSAHRMEQILQRLLEIEQVGALAIDREHERRMQDLDSMIDRFGLVPRVEASERDAAIARAEKAEEDLRCFLRGEPSASSMISGLLSRVIAAESRADVAEQLVAEMQATFGRLLKDHHVGHGGFPRSQCGVCKPIDEALALSAPIAGRWCLASERDAAPALASLTLQLESAHREVERLRTACEKVLSWSTKDTSMLLSNPPQNAALFHAQSVLRSALVRDDSNESQ